MGSTKESTHAFIIRIWVEPREIKDVEPKWRGVIEHVKSGEQVYFTNLHKLVAYITSYLEEMGIKEALRNDPFDR